MLCSGVSVGETASRNFRRVPQLGGAVVAVVLQDHRLAGAKEATDLPRRFPGLHLPGRAGVAQAVGDNEPTFTRIPSPGQGRGRNAVGTLIGGIGGGITATLGSVVIDAATGGLNILATPEEIATGITLGAAAGSTLTSGSTSHPEQCPVPVYMSKGGTQNKDNEYSRAARQQPDPCEGLRQTYNASSDSAERNKIKTVQKVLGCRRTGGDR